MQTGLPIESPAAPEVREFTAAKSALPQVQAAVRSLARAAKRAGLSPLPELLIDWASEREMKQGRSLISMSEGEVVGESSSLVVVPVVGCRITLPGGNAAARGDWRLLATLQRIDGDQQHSESTNEIFTAPKDLPKAEAWRHCALACEHCQAKRTRTKTLVLEETTTGRTKQVGKECASGYLGDNLELAVRELEFKQFVSAVLNDFEPDSGGFYGGGGGGSRLRAWDAEEVMSHAFACVRERGWQPTRILGPVDRYGEQQSETNFDATSLHVRDTLMNAPSRAARVAALELEIESNSTDLGPARQAVDPESSLVKAIARIEDDRKVKVEKLKEERAALLKPPYTVTEEDRARAARMVEWLSSQTPDPEKDKYLSELQAVFSAGFISEKRLGLAISGVRAQQNAERAAQQKAKAAASQYVGTPGDRTDFSLKLTGAFPYGGNFPGIAYRLEDAAGNQFSLLTGSHPFGMEDVDKEFVVKATVKEHSVYRESKTTMLTRLKVVREVARKVEARASAEVEVETAPGGARAAMMPLPVPRMAPQLSQTPVP